MQTQIQTPKNIDQLRRSIVPITRDHPELADKLREMVGYNISWWAMDLEQAWKVWWAWRALMGDERAAHMLKVVHNIQVEEREKVDPQEVARLRNIAERYRELEQMILTAHNPEWAYTDIKQALFNIIMERNTLVQALREKDDAEVRAEVRTAIQEATP